MDLYITSTEGVSLQDIAEQLLIWQTDGPDAFEAGNKNRLAHFVARAARKDFEKTAQLLRDVIAGVPHQSRVALNSALILDDDDGIVWHHLGEAMQFQHGQQPHGAQLARRLATAYRTHPTRVLNAMKQIVDLAGSMLDIDILIQHSLTDQEIKRLIARLEEEPTHHRSSRLVYERTVALTYAFLLTGLRPRQMFDLRGENLQVEDGLVTFTLEQGDEQRSSSRIFRVRDPLLSHHLQAFLETSQQWPPDPAAYLWQTDPTQPRTSHQDQEATRLSPWLYLKPLNRFAELAGLPSIRGVTLFATYARLVRDTIKNPEDIRQALIPYGNWTTDLNIRLPR